MSAIQETNNLGDLLKYEAPNLYSRDLATIAAGQNLLLGAVVGRDSTTGKLKELDPTATVRSIGPTSSTAAPARVSGSRYATRSARRASARCARSWSSPTA